MNTNEHRAYDNSPMPHAVCLIGVRRALRIAVRRQPHTRHTHNIYAIHNKRRAFIPYFSSLKRTTKKAARKPL